jgi:hypothetical protein
MSSCVLLPLSAASPRQQRVTLLLKYNFTENDFGEKRGRHKSSDDSSASSGGTRSVGSTIDDEPDPERFSRPYVPNHIVAALLDRCCSMPAP